MSRQRKRLAHNVVSVDTENEDHSPTSEVGSPPHQVNQEDRLCSILESQHRNLIEVIKAVRNGHLSQGAFKTVFSKVQPRQFGLQCCRMVLYSGSNPSRKLFGGQCSSRGTKKIVRGQCI